MMRTSKFGLFHLVILSALVLVASTFINLQISNAAFSSATEKKLIGSDTIENDRFGVAVAVDGDTMVVGSYHQNNRTGAVYVFEKSQGNWKQEAKLVPNDAAANDYFGCAVAIDANKIAVGAYGKESGTGAAYVFTRTGDTWTQQAKLIASDAAPIDNLGNSIALDRTTIVVGARSDENHAGAAYIFSFNGATWIQQAKLTPADTASNDEFGYSVSISNNAVLIGAFSKNEHTGAAYVFTRSGDVWSQQAKILPSDIAPGDTFGCSVAIDGDTAMIGAYMGSVNWTGAAYIFTRSGDTWSQQTKLTGNATNDTFGYTIALEGDTAIISGWGEANWAGSIYIYTNDGSNWVQQSRIAASDGVAEDEFGCSVDLSGSTIVVGARMNDAKAGAVYVYSDPATTSTATTTTTTKTTSSTTPPMSTTPTTAATTTTSTSTTVPTTATTTPTSTTSPPATSTTTHTTSATTSTATTPTSTSPVDSANGSNTWVIVVGIAAIVLGAGVIVVYLRTRKK